MGSTSSTLPEFTKVIRKKHTNFGKTCEIFDVFGMVAKIHFFSGRWVHGQKVQNLKIDRVLFDTVVKFLEKNLGHGAPPRSFRSQQRFAPDHAQSIGNTHL